MDEHISTDDLVVNRALMFCFKRLDAKQDVARDGCFDMELCLRKFAWYYRELFNEDDFAFLERQGKMLFLLYLAPLLNGKGFYHLESQLVDLRRTEAHEAAYEQLAGYLWSKGAKQGYLVTFDLRKSANRGKRGSAWETCAFLTWACKHCSIKGIGRDSSK